MFNYRGGLVKLSFAGNERYAPIIGDVGIDFLKDTVELELDDFGVFISETPPMLDDLQSFQSLVMASLQSGGLAFSDAMELLIEKDITIAIQRYKRMEAQRQREVQKQQAQQMAQQAKAAQEKEQAEMKKEITKIQAKGDADMEKQALQNEGDMNEVLVEGKIKMAGEKIDFSKELLLEKIKQRSEDRRERAKVKLSNKA